jgi:RNA polymerase sigma factor (sigma-70 family)
MWVVMDSGMTNEQFGRVVEQYQKLVYTICYQMVRDHYEAQNLAQETFLSAYTHIDRCREEDMKPWLCRIASNKAKDYLKSAYVRRVQLAREDEEGQEAEFRSVPDPEGSPDEQLMVSQGAEAIREMIRSLHEPYLKVSVLYFLEEKDVDEIALTLGRPRKTVQTQLYRAKLTLQKMIKEGA